MEIRNALTFGTEIERIKINWYKYRCNKTTEHRTWLENLETEPGSADRLNAASVSFFLRRLRPHPWISWGWTPTTSAQATPSSIPHFSPEQKPGGRFSSGSSTASPGPRSSTMDPGSGDKDRNSADTWSLFGPRSFRKSDSEGFATQPDRGAQKPSPMELMRMLATRKAEGPATFKPPKMDPPVMGGKEQPPRTPSLQPRDLNVLAPTSF